MLCSKRWLVAILLVSLATGCGGRVDTSTNRQASNTGQPSSTAAEDSSQLRLSPTATPAPTPVATPTEFPTAEPASTAGESQSVPAIMPPQLLLGKTLDQHEVTDFILQNGCSLAQMHYLCKSAGVELSLDTGQRVRTVWVYAQDADGFDAYRGEMPNGLNWQDTRADVVRKIGSPTESQAGVDDIRAWDSYATLGLLITYNTLSEDDSTARMFSILIQKP